MQLECVMNCIMTQNLFVKTEHHTMELKPCSLIIAIPNDEEQWGSYKHVGIVKIHENGIKWIPNQIEFKKIMFFESKYLWQGFLTFIFKLFQVSSIKLEIHHILPNPNEFCDDTSVLQLCKKTSNIPMHLKPCTFQFMTEFPSELLYLLSCNIILTTDQHFCFDHFFDCIDVDIIKFKMQDKIIRRRKIDKKKECNFKSYS